MTTVAATPEMQFCFDNRAPQTIERLLAACGFKKFIRDQNNWHMFVRAWKTNEIGAVEAGLVAPMLRPEALARQEQRKAQEHLKQELEKQAEQNDGFSRGEHGVMTN